MVKYNAVITRYFCVFGQGSLQSLSNLVRVSSEVLGCLRVSLMLGRAA